MAPHSQEFYALEGKLRRTVYAITFQDLVSNISTLSEDEIKILAKGMKKGVVDAVDKSLEFMDEHSMISFRRPRKKKAKKR